MAEALQNLMVTWKTRVCVTKAPFSSKCLAIVIITPRWADLISFFSIGKFRINSGIKLFSWFLAGRLKIKRPSIIFIKLVYYYPESWRDYILRMHIQYHLFNTIYTRVKITKSPVYTERSRLLCYTNIATPFKRSIYLWRKKDQLYLKYHDHFDWLGTSPALLVNQRAPYIYHIHQDYSSKGLWLHLHQIVLMYGDRVDPLQMQLKKQIHCQHYLCPTWQTSDREIWDHRQTSLH